jgi:predicted Zn-dependent protease
MKIQSILGFTGATLVTIFLFVSLTAFGLSDIPGVGKVAAPIAGKLLEQAVTPSTAATLANTFYNLEVRQKEKEDKPQITEQMTKIFDLLKKAALDHPTYGRVANEMEWKLNTLREKNTAMAKAFPGGGIAIYDGVFPIARNEGALAAILGHEMAHVLYRHELNRLKGDAAVAAANIGSAIALGTSPDKIDRQAMAAVTGALGIGYIFGVRQPWQRANELEADCLGLELAANAGYDPSKIKGFWRKMMNEEGANDSYKFLNDHPINQDRFDHIETQCMTTAKKDYAEVVKSGKTQDSDALLPGEGIS